MTARPGQFQRFVIDIGNSRIKWAIYDGPTARAIGVFPTEQFAGSAATLGLEDPAPGPEWSALPDTAGLAATQALVLCSVGQHAVEHHLLAFLHARGLPPLPVCRVAALPAALGVTNGYAAPARLGADRWAALVAAWTRHASAQVVVMAGTATTVDALDADGHFRGGYILPGLRLMPRSLYERTAGIRMAKGERQRYPTSTANAVASGVLAASAGAVAAMVRTLSADLSADLLVSRTGDQTGAQSDGAGRPVPVLLAGGNAEALAGPLADFGLSVVRVRDLVLEGAALLHAAGYTEADAGAG